MTSFMCLICRDSKDPNEIVYLDKCSVAHHFCIICLGDWIFRSDIPDNSCCFCRKPYTKVLKPDGSVFYKFEFNNTVLIKKLNKYIVSDYSVQTVENFIENYNLDIKNSICKDASPFNAACCADRLDIVKWMIEKYDIKKCDITLISVLSLCCISGTNVVKYLIELYNFEYAELTRYMPFFFGYSQQDFIEYLIDKYSITKDDIINKYFYPSIKSDPSRVDFLKKKFNIESADLLNKPIVIGYATKTSYRTLIWLLDNFTFSSLDLYLGNVWNIFYNEEYFDREVFKRILSYNWSSLELREVLTNFVNKKIFSCFKDLLDVVQWDLEDDKIVPTDKEVLVDLFNSIFENEKIKLAEYFVSKFKIDKSYYNYSTAIKVCSSKKSELGMLYFNATKPTKKMFSINNKDLFYIACSSGTLELSKWLIDHYKIKAETINWEYMSEQVCAENNIITMGWLLEKYNLKSEQISVHAAYLAIEKGHARIVRWLDQIVSLKDHAKWLFEHACKFSNKKAAEYLCQEYITRDYILERLSDTEFTTKLLQADIYFVAWLHDNFNLNFKDIDTSKADSNVSAWIVRKYYRKRPRPWPV